MRNLTRTACLISLTAILWFGAGQLRVNATSTCPPIACADEICFMYSTPVGTCYQNGVLQYIYQYDRKLCPNAYCYAPAAPS